MKWNYILMICLSLFSVQCSLFSHKDTAIKREISDFDVKAKKNTEEAYRKKLLLLPLLDANLERDAELLSHVEKAFAEQLNMSAELIVYSVQDMDKVKVEVKKSLEYDLASIANQVKDTGVTTVVEGKILDLRIRRKADPIGVVRKMKVMFDCVIRLRMYSNKTQKEIFNTVKTVTLTEDNVRIAEKVESDAQLQNNPEIVKVVVKDAFFDFIPQVLTALTQVTWEGRIAAIKGERIFLNVGRQTGLQIGDLLKVVDIGSDIYDPEDGNHIGRVPGRIKGTLEVISYFGQDGSIAILHSGAQFKENDKVELY